MNIGCIVEVGSDLILLFNELVLVVCDIIVCVLFDGDVLVYIDLILVVVELNNCSKIYCFLLDDFGGYFLSNDVGEV